MESSTLSVSETQLTTWSNPGATQAAQATYSSIKQALSGSGDLRDYEYDVFLQGSYGNATNIRGNSDVDVVIELDSAFFSDLSQLTERERVAYSSQRTSSSVTYEDFRDAVQAVLESYYGKTLVSGRNKCIAIAAGSGRLEADVIPCLELRRYRRFEASREDFIAGIKFITRSDRRQVVNYPKPHRQNGVDKNSRTGANYKPSVRILKNWRDRLIDDGKIAGGLAPSYFVECLASNVPDAAFQEIMWQRKILACLKHLSTSDLSTYMCQNGVTPLFGNTPEQWQQPAAQTFVNALVNDWNKGR